MSTNSNVKPGEVPLDDFECEATELVDFESLDIPSLSASGTPTEFESHPIIDDEHEEYSISDFGLKPREWIKPGPRKDRKAGVIIGDGRGLDERSTFDDIDAIDRNADPLAFLNDTLDEDSFSDNENAKTEFTDIGGEEDIESSRTSPLPPVTRPNEGLVIAGSLARHIPTEAVNIGAGLTPPDDEKGVSNRTNPHRAIGAIGGGDGHRGRRTRSAHFAVHPASLEETTIGLDDDDEESTATDQQELGSRRDDVGLHTTDPLRAASPHVGKHGEEPEDAIFRDAALREQFLYERDAIHIGEVTIVFAQDPFAQPVILRQVWSNELGPIPDALRMRLDSISKIKHDKLITPTRILNTATGVWVAFPRPPGFRLSDVIQSNGPQSLSLVKRWVSDVADVVSFVHNNHVAYANLCPDAIWVQENGPTHLEPFDILTFENRGDLSDFGPPELHVKEGQPRLSPASDVYSLAAVALATLTGLPFDLDNVSKLQGAPKVAIRKALDPEPTQRYRTIRDFTADFLHEPSFVDYLKKCKNYVIVVLVLSLIGGAIFFYFNQEHHAPLGNPVAGEPANAKVPPPGPVKRFSIISIETSYVTNPPDLKSEKVSLEPLKKLILQANEELQQDPTQPIPIQTQAKIVAFIKDFHQSYPNPFSHPLSEDDWEVINFFNLLPMAYVGEKRPASLLSQAIELHNLNDIREKYKKLSDADPASLISPELLKETPWEFTTLTMYHDGHNPQADLRLPSTENKVSTNTSGKKEVGK